MNVCLIIDDYLPDSIKVGAKMMHELAVELVSSGHQVTVIVPAPNIQLPYNISIIDGVTVCRFRSGKIKNIGKVKRAINESLLSWQAWRALRKYFIANPHDLIVYYSPSIFWGALVMRLKYLWSAKSYLILRDFFPQWVIDSGMLSKWSPITAYFKFFEWLSYRAANVIGIQSPKNIDVFKRLHNISRPLEVLYNWSSNIGQADSSDYYRESLGLTEKVVFFYGGNIGAAQDMMNIVRLARRLNDDHRAHFVLVGSGDEVSLIQQAISSGDAGNMTLLPSVSQLEYEKMLSEFDIGLFSLHAGHSAHNFPGKLLGYMANQKPILGSINVGNDLEQVVCGANAGFISVNGDDDVLLANARQLLNSSELRSCMGNNGKLLLNDTFSVNAAASLLLKSIKR
jgi:O26-antigen biosynthesis N-acetyl-L-fucosamine transferase